jgi:oligoribonuclease NrnB/cAMP/cGMP phosphodiesterase (DHH superfamily)
VTHYYAFNGDADGLCALQQLRLVDVRDATLVTGVKRDIRLLERVHAVAGDEVTVLDISLDQNRTPLQWLLESGALVRYFDHHYAGGLPTHASTEPHIEEKATSARISSTATCRAHRVWRSRRRSATGC